MSTDNIPTSSRGENSLFSLTHKFLDLIKDTFPLPVALNSATRILEVPKRRIYYVTNILMGLGLIKKVGVGKVQWSGLEINSYLQTRQESSKENPSNREIEDLITEEKNLDIEIQIEDGKLGKITEKDSYAQVLYVTHQDILNCEEYGNKKIFLAKVPENMHMNYDKDNKYNYLELRTGGNKIDLYFISEYGPEKLHPEK